MSRPGPSYPPISFKTVPGRNRTQKWQQAKAVDYGGDDWGGYDEYGDEEPFHHQNQPQPQQQQQQQQQYHDRTYGQPQHHSQHTQSPSPHRLPRTNSFNQGDERQAFSAANSRRYDDQPFDARDPSATSTATFASSSRSRSRPRDHPNLEQAPASMRSHGLPPSSRSEDRLPPRKSSRTSLNSEGFVPEDQGSIPPASATARAPSPKDKPLPFIRPSDIYKRIPEEQARMSEEGARPSVDSLHVHRENDVSPAYSNNGNGRSGLDPISESRESRLLSDDPQLATSVAGLAQTVEQGEERFHPELLHLRGVSDTDTPPIEGVSTSFDGQALRTSESVEDSSRAQSMGTRGTAHIDVITSSGPHPGLRPLQPTPVTFQVPESLDSGTAKSIPVQSAADSSRDMSKLQHQPSQGFRSAVHQAFDPKDSGLSRDNSQSISGASLVSRSDTNSTSTGGISPIMSQISSHPQIGLGKRDDAQVPTITEEPSTNSTGSLSLPQSSISMHPIKRKPSPSHSRNVSGEFAMPAGDFEPGYRRSMDPPSSGSTPTHHPVLGEVLQETFNEPMVAETVEELGAVESEATKASMVAQNPTPMLVSKQERRTNPSSIVIPGRSRADTDFSIREADIANAVNSSPNDDVNQPDVLAAVRASREAFLKDHTDRTVPPHKDTQLETEAATYGGRSSPTKGRVRDLADKIEMASRPSSAASNGSASAEIRGSHDNLFASNRKGPVASQGDDMFPRYGNAGPSDSSSPQALGAPAFGVFGRPTIDRGLSFEPEMPGGWISSAPTPALETPPAIASALTPNDETALDLTPTTKKVPLQEVIPSFTPDTLTQLRSTAPEPSALEAVKNVGKDLGVALLSTVGLGHQTKDFASSETSVPAEQPNTQNKALQGPVQMPPPPLTRLGTDDTIDELSSVASTSGPSLLASPTTEESTDSNAARPINEYFETGEAPLPLRVATKDTAMTKRISEMLPQRPSVLQTLSSDTMSDDTESDRLRKEIVRSLDSSRPAEGSGDDVQRTEDVNHASTPSTIKSRNVENGTFEKLGLLDQRFSWEDTSQGPAPTFPPAVSANASAAVSQEVVSPEIRPEAVYERPRNKALGVVNADVEIEPSLEQSPPTMSLPVVDQTAEEQVVPSPPSANAVSPISPAQENLRPLEDVNVMTELDPSPLSENGESVRLPSYYLSDQTADDVVSDVITKDISTINTVPVESRTSLPAVPPKDSAAYSGSIPSFRNILAMKTSTERIETYQSTRRTFSEMNTGLQDWLSNMITANPAYAELEKVQPPRPVLQTSGIGTFRRVTGHKQSPSISIGKLANRFGAGGASEEQTTAGTASASSPSGGNKTAGVDMERMQQRGKDFMKSAGVLGGRAQAGAKGLFTKGKSRFGGSGGTSGGKVASSFTSASDKPHTSATAPSASAHDAHNVAATPSVSIPVPLLNAIAPAATETKGASIAPDYAAQASASAAVGGGEHQSDETSTRLRTTTSDMSASTYTTESPKPPPLSYVTVDAPSLKSPPSSNTTKPMKDLAGSDNAESEGVTRDGSIVEAAFVEPPVFPANSSPPPPGKRLSAVVGGRRRISTSRPRPVSESIQGTFGKLRDFSMGGKKVIVSKGDKAEPTKPTLEIPRMTDDHDSELLPAVMRASHDAQLSVAVQGGNANNDAKRDVEGQTATSALQLPRRSETWHYPDAQLPRTPNWQSSSSNTEPSGFLPSPVSTLWDGTSTMLEQDGAVIQEGLGSNYEPKNPRMETSQQVSGKTTQDVSLTRSDLPDEDTAPGTIPSTHDQAVASGPATDAESEAETFIASLRTGATFEPLVMNAVRADQPTMTDSDSRLPPKPINKRRKSDVLTLPSQRSRQASVSTRGPSPLRFPSRYTITGNPETAAIDHELQNHTTRISPSTYANENEAVESRLPSSLQILPIEDIARPVPHHLSSSRTSPALDSEISRPSTADNWSDARSTVSIDGIPFLATEEREEAPGKVLQPPYTRVSNIEGTSPETEAQLVRTPWRAAVSPTESMMSVNAVFDRPVTLANEASLQSNEAEAVTTNAHASKPQKETYRPTYRPSGPVTGERPLSYLPQSQAFAGTLVPRTRSAEPQGAREFEQDLVTRGDLSANGASSIGRPSFRQYPQHRENDEAEQTEHEKMRSKFDTNSQSINASLPQRSSRRLSNLFRGRPQTADPSFSVAASMISDQHGLEDLQHMRASPESQAVQMVSPTKQDKQRSGIFSALLARRASATQHHVNHENSIPSGAMRGSEVKPADNVHEGVVKSRKLKKTPREGPPASNTKAEPKRRFSAMASMFGRSNEINQANASKPNRLTKRDATIRRPSTSQNAVVTNDAPNGNLHDFDNSEVRMRRQEMRTLQEGSIRLIPPGESNTAGSNPDSRYRPSSAPFLPVNDNSPVPSARSPFLNASIFGRRSSSGTPNPFNELQESFRPSGSSLERHVQSNNPSSEHLLDKEPRLPTLPLPAPLGSDASHLLRNQGSSTGEDDHLGGHGFVTNISPIQTEIIASGEYSLPPQQPSDSRRSSHIYSGPVAHNRVSDHVDQRLLRVTTLPDGGLNSNFDHRRRPTSWTSDTGEASFVDARQHSRGQLRHSPVYNFTPLNQDTNLAAAYRRSPQPRSASFDQTRYLLSHQSQQRMPRSHENEAQRSYSQVLHHQQQSVHGSQYQGDQRSSPEIRQGGGAPSFSLSRHHGRRSFGEFSGRRDDPALGEEAIYMLGASSPEQGWDNFAGHSSRNRDDDWE